MAFVFIRRDERLLPEVHAGLPAFVRERDGDEVLEAVVRIPRKREDQTLGPDHLTKHAAMPKLAAVRDALQAAAPAAADACVDLELRRGVVTRAPPLHGVLRIGPCRPD